MLTLQIMADILNSVLDERNAPTFEVTSQVMSLAISLDGLKLYIYMARLLEMFC